MQQAGLYSKWPEVAIFRQKMLKILATFPPIFKSFGLFFAKLLKCGLLPEFWFWHFLELFGLLLGMQSGSSEACIFKARAFFEASSTLMPLCAIISLWRSCWPTCPNYVVTIPPQKTEIFSIRLFSILPPTLISLIISFEDKKVRQRFSIKVTLNASLKILIESAQNFQIRWQHSLNLGH